MDTPGQSRDPNDSCLRAVATRFWSPLDEQSFFDWLEAIECVTSVKGEGVCLNIAVDRDAMDDANLRELLALFIRYDIDLRQLGHFLTSKNKRWFADPRATWHSAIFGEVRVTLRWLRDGRQPTRFSAPARFDHQDDNWFESDAWSVQIECASEIDADGKQAARARFLSPNAPHWWLTKGSFVLYEGRVPVAECEIVGNDT